MKGWALVFVMTLKEQALKSVKSWALIFVMILKEGGKDDGVTLSSCVVNSFTHTTDHKLTHKSDIILGKRKKEKKY